MHSEQSIDDNSMQLEVATLPKPASLLGLPPELLSIVLRLAYPIQDGVGLRSRHWHDLEEQRQRRAKGAWTYQGPPFPNKVNDFIVSKAFFVEAGKAYVQNHTGITSAMSGLAFALGTGIVRAFTTTITITGVGIGYVNRCLPGVTSLKALLDDSDFKNYGTDYMWQTTMTAEELRQLPCYESAIGLKGVLRFEVGSNELHEEDQRPPAERAVWHANLKTFEDIVKLALKDVHPRPRPPVCLKIDTCGHQQPLYYWSEVYWPKVPNAVCYQPIEGSGHEPMLTAKLSESPSARRLGMPLRNSDIPETALGLQQLALQDGDALVAWIRNAKQALSSISERRSDESTTM